MIREPTETFRNLYERTQSGKAGPRQAIKMQCAECVGYDRNEITNCTDIGCPLYNYRPFAGIKRRKAPLRS